jgi:hypothetical protein
MSRTVKIRVAVSVDPEGHWYAVGYANADEKHLRESCDELDPGEAHYWLEAELPVPETQTVQATVTKAEP